MKSNEEIILKLLDEKDRLEESYENFYKLEAELIRSDSNCGLQIDFLGHEIGEVIQKIRTIISQLEKEGKENEN